MKHLWSVSTGEVLLATGEGILVCNALGSCVGVAAHEPRLRIGAMAHIMLPGHAPAGAGPGSTRYAAQAVRRLLQLVAAHGVDSQQLTVCIAGGGNVLQRDDDTICADNISSVRQLLADNRLAVRAQSVGGCWRRRFRLDVGAGVFYCSVGEGPERVMHTSDRTVRYACAVAEV